MDRGTRARPPAWSSSRTTSAATDAWKPDVKPGGLLAARHRRDDRHLVAVGDGGGGAVEQACVVVVDIDVDEPADLAVRSAQLPLEPLVAALQPFQDVAKGGAFENDHLVTAGLAAQDRGDPHLDCHDVLPWVGAGGTARVHEGTPEEGTEPAGRTPRGAASAIVFSKTSMRGSMTG